ncbi:MAG: hypothetical protein M3436_08295 [Pseudomonadota bacterium]|nr:hypothetical protein [Pseudomonadota bacterium]
MTDSRQPGHAVADRVGMIMLRQNAADDIFVDLNTKGVRDLLCNLPTTQAGITSFHFNDRRNDFFRWPLGTRTATLS